MIILFFSLFFHDFFFSISSSLLFSFLRFSLLSFSSLFSCLVSPLFLFFFFLFLLLSSLFSSFLFLFLFLFLSFVFSFLSLSSFSVCWWCVCRRVCRRVCLCVVCVVQMIQSTPCLSRVMPTMHLIWVAEHLGASSRRPRHPFPALMAGGNPWPCTCVHGQKNQPINRRTAPVELQNRDIDHHSNVLRSSTACTATLALQLELEVVVVVGANIVIAADRIIEHANTPNDYKSTGCN